MRIISSVLMCALVMVGSTIAAAPRSASTIPGEAVAQTAIDVTGTWALQLDLGNGQGGSPSVTLTQEGEKLTGTYTSPVIGEHQVTGTVKGNAVTFGFEASFDGNAVKVTYSGTVENDTMKGSVQLGDFANGTFTGKKK